MSESQTQSYKPAATAAKRVSPVLIWIVVLLIAGGAFAGAFYWAGGIDGVSGLLGIGAQPPSPAKPAGSAAASSTASVAGTLPPDAQAKMYAEQLESQPYITQLADGQISALSLGQPVVSAQAANIPVKVKLSGGAVVSGGITLRQYNGTWYFVSIHAAGQPDTVSPPPSSFDAGVVQVITGQQATAASQELIKDGLLGGGYKQVSFVSDVAGAGTRTVNVDLTGGSEAASHGRLVLIEKVDAGTSYWFIARFEKK